MLGSARKKSGTQPRDAGSRADPVSSLGILAEGVADRFEKPIAYVLANLGVAMDELERLSSEPEWAEKLAEVVGSLRKAKAGAHRIHDANRALRILCRGAEELRAPVDVRRVLESSIHLAENAIRHRARMVTRFAELPPVSAHETLLGHVFLSLLMNAAHAIPEGGADQNQIEVTAETAGESIVIEIADTGVRISGESIDETFEPFFTTKAVEVGLGFELGISRQIVEGHGGSISVKSERGRTVLRVRLPIGTRHKHTPVPETLASQRARILVLDDEPLIGKALERLLATDHDVDVCTDARDALRRIATGARFDAVLCDLQMPDMTGMDLYEALERVAPATARRMIFMSGGAFTPRARRFLEESKRTLIDKPIDARLLREAIAQVVRDG